MQSPRCPDLHRLRPDPARWKPIALALLCALSSATTFGCADNADEDSNDSGLPPASAPSTDGSVDANALDASDGVTDAGSPQPTTDAANEPQAAAGGSDAGDASAAADASATADASAAADAGDSTGQLCGTRGAEACSSGQFCNYEPDADCGATDRGGQCETIPTLCTADYTPVCGCDYRSYGNACNAHAAGVSVLHEGACTADECVTAGGQPRYGDGGVTPECDPGDSAWNIGAVMDPAVCCLPEPPPSPGTTCGGIAALRCDDGAFCNYEPEAGGLGCDGTVADASGQCEPIPELCSKEFEPVCGCDHLSYDNRCSAHAAAVAVLHEGFCTVSDCLALGGRAVAGIGPGPMCADDEEGVTSIINDDGSLAIEGMLCCVKR